MIVLVFLMTGSLLKVELVWELADMFNGLMVIPNIIAVIGLYKLVVKACSDYEDHYLKGEKAHFGPSEKLTGKLARIAVRRRRRRALSQSSGNEDAVSDVLKDGNDE